MIVVQASSLQGTVERERQARSLHHKGRQEGCVTMCSHLKEYSRCKSKHWRRVTVQFCMNLKSIHTSIRALRYSARTDFGPVHSSLNSFGGGVMPGVCFRYDLYIENPR